MFKWSDYEYYFINNKKFFPEGDVHLNAQLKQFLLVL